MKLPKDYINYLTNPINPKPKNKTIKLDLSGKNLPDEQLLLHQRIEKAYTLLGSFRPGYKYKVKLKSLFNPYGQDEPHNNRGSKEKERRIKMMKNYYLNSDFPAAIFASSASSSSRSSHTSHRSRTNSANYGNGAPYNYSTTTSQTNSISGYSSSGSTGSASGKSLPATPSRGPSSCGSSSAGSADGCSSSDCDSLSLNGSMDSRSEAGSTSDGLKDDFDEKLLKIKNQIYFGKIKRIYDWLLKFLVLVCLVAVFCLDFNFEENLGKIKNFDFSKNFWFTKDKYHVYEPFQPQTNIKSDPKNNCSITLGENLAKIPLISFPGSGNTWLRHLIEEISGVFTGSVYNDGRLYDQGFSGEFEDPLSGKVIVVKTHLGNGIHQDEKWPPMEDLMGLKASKGQNEDGLHCIYLMRHPIDTYFSTKAFQHSKSHVGESPTYPDFHSSVNRKNWQLTIKKWAHYYYNTYTNLEKHCSKGIKLVFYEDLVKNPWKLSKNLVTWIEEVNEEESRSGLSKTKTKRRKRSVIEFT